MNNKDFSLTPTGTIKSILQEFKKIKDPRTRFEIPLPDILMSALAIFKLKYPSVLSFETHLADKELSQNLRNTFFIENKVSDQGLKDVLDIIDPTLLKNSFKTLHCQIEKEGILDEYKLFGEYLPAAGDASESYTSNKIYNSATITRKHKNGDNTYHMQLLTAVIVAPDKKIVFPYMPEPIQNSDGNSKNDCETNAFKRLLQYISSDFPNRKHVFLLDSLYSKTPTLESILCYGHQFITNCKEGDHKFLFKESIPRLENKGLLTYNNAIINNANVQFRFINNIPIFKNSDSIQCSFIEYKEQQKDGSWKRFTWLTSFEVNLENVFTLVKYARARWKIENETFNCLKNYGYNMEHNYGLGKKFLRSNLAIIMMLAFLTDQINEAACPLVQKAIKHSIRRSYYWATIIKIFGTFICLSFDQIIEFIVKRDEKKWVSLESILGSQ